MKEITSKDNQKIKSLKALRDKKKERRESRLFYVEGERIIKNIDISLINEVYIDENYEGYIPKINDDSIYKIPTKLFDDIKDTVTTQGIIATIKMDEKRITNTKTDTRDVAIILDNVQDPGNVGTILRTAEAAGIMDVILLNDVCDPYSPKVIRSSMSSITRLNIIEPKDSETYVKGLKKDGYKIYGTFLDDSTSFYKENYIGKTAIIFGNEANGISDNIAKLCDIRLNIPMDGLIESLNVAESVGIVLYEIKRQRGCK